MASACAAASSGSDGHVQAAEDDEHALGAVRVGERVGAARVGDVDLNGDEIGTVVAWSGRDVLVDDLGLVVWVEVGGERGQAERREQRVFDRPPVRAGGFGQGRQDELHAQAVPMERHRELLEIRAPGDHTQTTL